jgi:hypothetical protein
MPSAYHTVGPSEKRLESVKRDLVPQERFVKLNTALRVIYGR